MAAVTNGEEFAAVFDDNRGKVVAAVIIASVLADFRLQQLTQFLWVDMDAVNCNETRLAIWAKVGSYTIETPYSRLASYESPPLVDQMVLYYYSILYIKMQ